MERDANPPDAMDATAAAAGTPLEDEDAAAAADAAARVEEAWSWGVEDAVPGDVEVHAFDDELALIRGFIATVRALDPDVLVGFEMQGESLGWLAERAGALGVGLLREISRDERVPGAAERQDDEYGRLHASGIYVTGRIVLNLWRILRGELKLQSYTFESCAHAVLCARVRGFRTERYRGGREGATALRETFSGRTSVGTRFDTSPNARRWWRACWSSSTSSRGRANRRASSGLISSASSFAGRNIASSR